MLPIRPTLAAVLLCAALSLSGCNSAEDPTPSEQIQATTQASDAGITFEKMWVKATDESMTAVFGTLHNTTAETIHVVGLECDVAGRAELHETVNKDGQMMMQEMADGFEIPAGEAAELAPGGNHLMLMELKEAIKPGAEITVRLKLADGSSVEFQATAREFKGAKEEYGVHGEEDAHNHGDHDGHEHGDHDAHDGHEHGDEKKDDGN